MIKFENIQVFNFNNALRGLRNPKNSWDKSDSCYGITNKNNITSNLDKVANTYLDPAIAKIDLLKNGLDNPYIVNDGDYSNYAFIGAKDLKLCQTMIGAGTDESKFMRQIFISIDITAPLYWWKEFDTYKVGTVSDSCSTMHKIQENKFTLDDFSHEHMSEIAMQELERQINVLEAYRNLYNNWDTTDLEIKKKLLFSMSDAENKKFEQKDAWWQMIQSLPSSYNQRRTITLNYQVARAMFFARRFHKLDDWRKFCELLTKLPYGKSLICYEKKTA